MGSEVIDLGDFLADNLRRPYVSGEWDCCTFPSAWAIARGFADPMAGWRGAYRDDDEAQDIITLGGGLSSLFDAGLVSVGARRVEQSEAGDIGIISILGHEAGAVYTGRRWAFVAERGLGFVSLEPGAVARLWRLPTDG